jgi:DNA-binding CsgD family transcriptional regulator
MTHDPMLRARIELDLTIEVLQSGELAVARTHAHAALALAETIGEPALLVEGLVNAAMVDFLLGKGTANDLISRAEQLAEDENRRSDLAPTLLHPEFTAATLLKWADEFEPARRKFEALLRLARERNEEGWIAPILFQLGELECWFGNWEVAGRYADRARETASQLGSPSMGTLAVYLRALVDAYVGRLDDAGTGAEQAAAAFEQSSNVRHLIRSRGLLGFVALSLGDAADAQRHLGAAGELSTAYGYADPGVLRFQADLIEALVGVGDIDQAEALTDELAERGRSLDRPWARATSARCRGLVCAARGDTDRALRALDQALLEHERLLQPFEYARTLLVLGSVRRRARQKRSAREALEQARDLFERLGTPLWAEKAHEQLRRIGGRAPVATGLTPTEEKIAELVAQGSTNPEVAETLFMSRKTVERHLTHIFQKLDVRSRRELARAFAARSRADRP